MELSAPGRDDFASNPARIFQVMSNELGTPKILVCPADSKRQPALNFQSLQPANVSYRVYSGTNVKQVNPQEVLAICPIHHNVLLSDGSVQGRGKGRGWPARIPGWPEPGRASARNFSWGYNRPSCPASVLAASCSPRRGGRGPNNRYGFPRAPPRRDPLTRRSPAGRRGPIHRWHLPQAIIPSA